MTFSLKITSHWEINEMCIDSAFKDKLGCQVFKGALKTNHRNETQFILQGFTRSPWKSAVKICVYPWGLQASPEANGQAPQARAGGSCKCKKGSLRPPLAVSYPASSPSLFVCTKETLSSCSISIFLLRE